MHTLKNVKIHVFRAIWNIASKNIKTVCVTNVKHNVFNIFGTLFNPEPLRKVWDWEDFKHAKLQNTHFAGFRRAKFQPMQNSAASILSMHKVNNDVECFHPALAGV